MLEAAVLFSLYNCKCIDDVQITTMFESYYNILAKLNSLLIENNITVKKKKKSFLVLCKWGICQWYFKYIYGSF